MVRLRLNNGILNLFTSNDKTLNEIKIAKNHK